LTTIIGDEKDPKQGEYLDPYSIFKYAMNSPVTRDRYTTRLDRFFSFGVQGANIEERCKVFVQNARKDNGWAFRSIINFLQVQKDRVDRNVWFISIHFWHLKIKKNYIVESGFERG
jgi:hypothetical protein